MVGKLGELRERGLEGGRRRRRMKREEESLLIGFGCLYFCFV